MWSLIGLVTARQQLRASGMLIARVAVRAPVRSGVVLRRGFVVSSRRSAAAAAAAGGKKAATTTRKASSTTKKPAAKKNATKKKATKKKAVAKKVPKKKKVLSDQEKRTIIVRQLKAVALLHESPKQLPANPFMAFSNEYIHAHPSVTNMQAAQERMVRIAEAYKALSTSEIERLRAIAERNKLANDAAKSSWVQSHTPQEIDTANNARRRLNRLGVYKHPLRLIKDYRIPKRPATSYLLFVKSRVASLSATDVGQTREAFKQAAVAWKTLSDSERQPYLDNAAVDRARYVKEVQTVLGRSVAQKKEVAAA